MALGSIVVRLTMRTAEFETDAGRASKVAERRAKEIDAAFKRAGTAIGVALGATVAGITSAVRGVAQAAREIDSFSRISGAGAVEFQRWAAGAATAGLSQEKLADQLKDFNEKLGEFVQTGGGGMKDFFEQIAPKVGVTADQFRRLSGPEGLQLYFDSLEKAGLSQQQMSFYLESMASDTTALIPLLRDGGAGMKEFGDQAERTGKVMDEQTLRAALELESQLKFLGMSFQGARNEVVAEMIPALSDLIEEFTRTETGADGVTSAARRIGEGFGAAIRGAANLIDRLTILRAEMRRLELGAQQLGPGAGVQSLLSGGRYMAPYEEMVREQQRLAGQAEAARARIEGRNNPDAPGVVFAGSGQEPAGLFRRPAPAGGVWLPPKTGSAKKSKSGKSDAERMAEEAARAAREAAEAQLRWNGTVLDMEAALSGPVAEAHREYDRNLAAINASLNEGHITLSDYARAMDAYGAQRDKELKAIAERKTPAQEMLDDMLFEIELLGKSREAQELLTAARWLGAEAATAQGQAALAAMQDLQVAEKAISDQIALMDAFRDGAADALTDFVTGAKSAKDALKDFFDSMAAMITRMIAERWIETLFGSRGQSGGGKSGNFLADIFGALLGGKGWAHGGYTGPGGMYQPAGIVHRGEVVWSQSDVARAGGVPAVEAMRHGRSPGNNLTQTFIVQGSPDRRTREQMARESGRAAAKGMRRTGR